MHSCKGLTTLEVLTYRYMVLSLHGLVPRSRELLPLW